VKYPIRIGVGGWTYEPWRGTFFPTGLTQKRELEYASRQLTTIEINGTFYGLQKPQSFAKWHEETPEDFVFALKAPRFITNRRALASAGPALDRFLASGLTELQGKLGPINWQLAPEKAFDSEDLSAFLKMLPPELKGLRLRHAMEVRHESFRNAEFVELARNHGVAIVVAADSPYPQIPDLTAPFVYARIMGTTAAHTSGYSAAALTQWAKRAATWASGQVPEGMDPIAPTPTRISEREVFIYVISGYKERNPAAARGLIERLN